MRSAEKPSRPKLRSVDPERVSRGDEAEARAAALYDSGYWCGEAVVATVNELAGHPLPPDISRLASGFCEGFGGSRCTCGALAGAVMAAGMFVGRIGPDEPWEPVYDAAGELRHRFVLDQCATTCDEIARRYGGMHKPERWAHCAELVGKCARWTVEIGEDQGWL
ncbi:MAG: C_GCAxxG_C_C family protein [Coriobacteriales bacterium]|nr:C_GCAxxG_C_C family protein [Coriobacteriales bacterium]